jgi:hypothetical protein
MIFPLSREDAASALEALVFERHEWLHTEEYDRDEESRADLMARLAEYLGHDSWETWYAAHIWGANDG